MVPTRRGLLGTFAASVLLAGCSSESTDTASTERLPTTTQIVTPTPSPGPTTTDPGTPIQQTATRTDQSTTDGSETTTAEDSSERGDPDYVDPSAFSEEEVSLAGPEDCTLGGTISLPSGEETVPGVVIVHGSGPQDRDGTIGPFAPYADIARGLASQGIAVLRYDKRTVACPENVRPLEITIDDIVTDDALTAVERLREHERVDPERLVVAGHSFGGALAPRIALRDQGLAGIAMLAANARPLPILGVEQSRRRLQRQGEITDEEEQQLQAAQERAERLATGEFDDADVPRGTGPPFWESLAAYDQQEAASQVSEPIFLAQGERDRQVIPETEFERWRETLGGHPNVHFETYSEANHYFVAGPAPTPLWNDPVENEHVLGALVSDLAAWIATATGPS